MTNGLSAENEIEKLVLLSTLITHIPTTWMLRPSFMVPLPRAKNHLMESKRVPKHPR
ncbi:MAG: hypothetical protein JKY45_13280 [Emcibacter sp.]|nr:hypothetical protein [Emcibacter sp.]